MLAQRSQCGLESSEFICAKDLGTDCYTYKGTPSVHGSAAWSRLVYTSLEEQTVQTSAQTSAERLVQRD